MPSKTILFPFLAPQSRAQMRRFAGFWLLVFSCLLNYGCATKTVSPQSPESSMLVGRILINNNYKGPNGLLPLGLQDQHIRIEMRSEDWSRISRVTTHGRGYFFLPNLPPDLYHIRSVALEAVYERREDGIRLAGQFLKTRLAPGKITYIGTLWLDVSKDGEIKTKELYEPEEAKQQVSQLFAGTGWEEREFTSDPPTPGPPSVGKLPAPRRQPPPPGRKRVPF